MKLSRSPLRSEQKTNEIETELRFTPRVDPRIYTSKNIPLPNEEQAKVISYSLIKYVNGIAYPFIVPRARSKELRQISKLCTRMTKRFKKLKAKIARQE